MKSNNPVRGRIPAANLPNFKRWNLPRVEGQQTVRSPFQQKPRNSGADQPEVEEIDLSDMTVEMLQALRDEAKREGYAEGLALGKEKGEAEGLAAGRESGYQAAFEQAYAEAQGQIDDLKARLSGLINGLHSPWSGQREELEAALLTLITDIARAVVGDELKTRPELLRKALAQALNVLPQQEPLVFTVHADDEPILLEIKAREGAAWDVKTDVSMTPGSLRARSINSYLDYGVEGRFREVMEALLAGAAERPPVEEDPGA